MSERTTPGDIQRAYFDNLRDNQIGGQTDGVAPEVAADLGYTTYEDMVQIAKRSVGGDATEFEQPREPISIEVSSGPAPMPLELRDKADIGLGIDLKLPEVEKETLRADFRQSQQLRANGRDITAARHQPRRF